MKENDWETFKSHFRWPLKKSSSSSSHTLTFTDTNKHKKSFTEENIFQKNIFHIERVWKMERSREVKQRVVWKTQNSKTMPFSTEIPENPSSPFTLKKRPPSWSDFWVKNTKPLKHVIFTMIPNSNFPKSQTPIFNFPNSDQTLRLSDQILLQILSKLPDSQRNTNSLVCKCWLNLQGCLVQSLKLLD